MEKVLSTSKENIIGQLAGISSCLLWGLAFVYSKVLVRYFDAITINFVRYMISSIFIFLIIKVTGVQIRLNKKIIKKAALSGILGMAVYNLFTTLALKSVSASMVSIFNGAIPIFTLLIDTVFVSKKGISKKLALAAVLSFLGILIVVLGNGNEGLGKGSIIGYIFLSLSLASWLCYTFVGKSIMENNNRLVILQYQVLSSCLIFLPIGLFTVKSANVDFRIFLNTQVIISFIVLGVFCSAVGFIFYSKALVTIGHSMSALYMNLMPVVSVVASWFVLGESLTLNKIIGVVIVVASLIIGGNEA